MKYELNGTTLSIQSEPHDPWAGKVTVQGVYDDPSHGKMVDCGTIKVAGKPRALKIRLADKPDLAALVAKRQQVIDDAKAAELADRKAKEDSVKATCPADHECVTRKWANGDLCSACYVTADGVEVLDSDLLESSGMGIWYLPKSTCDVARAQVKSASDKRSAEQMAESKRRDELIAKARETGEPQVIGVHMETRRAKEGGEWGEYQFAITTYINADGTTFTTSKNTY